MSHTSSEPADLITKSDFLEQPKEIFFAEEIQTAIQAARTICQEQGHDSTNCAQAWAMVDELQAEAAYQQALKLDKTALEEYLEENPQVIDNLMMENWCSG